MIRRKRATVLGVSLLAALGLMSVSVAGAQAAQWTIDGKTMSELKLGYEKVALSGGPLYIDALVDLECEEQSGSGYIFDGGASSANLLLSGCVVVEGQESCQVGYNGSGLIKLQASTTLSGNGAYVRFAPPSGAFGSITLEDAEYECSVIEPESGSETKPLTGEFAGELGPAAVEPSLSFSAGIDAAAQSTGLWIDSYWGMNTSLDGTASISLSGANTGKVLGASS